MPVKLRDYQQAMWDETRQAWAQGHKYVLDVLATGGGKTWLLAAANDSGRPSVTIAHRQELLGQISETYATAGIEHNIIAPQKVTNLLIQRQIKKIGRSYYHPSAPAALAGIDTLIRRYSPGDRWCNQIEQWSTDEGHHALGLRLSWDEANKWGKGCQLFPNARGFAVTATPTRADGRSLHIEQGGCYDHLVQGIGMRELIDMGSLCDYRVIAPKSSIDEAVLKIGSTGDFTDRSVKKAVEQSKITGDIVSTYLERTPGKQAIVFVVGTEQAKELAQKFRDAGVSASALDGNTPDAERQRDVDSFAEGRIRVLVNVGLFDEGFDVPAVEVCIMGAPTMSYGRFAQQIGRCLRPANGKQFGIIIDHVGNVLRMAEKHGMPDTPRRWQLWREPRKRKDKDPDAIPMRVCESCTLTYEATTMVCPYCGHTRVPEDRSAPEQVDGILQEMSPELLHRLRMARAEVLAPVPKIPNDASEMVAAACKKRHAARQVAHQQLQEAMEFWGGAQLAAGYSDTQMQARFLHRFGIDVLSAQGLNAKRAVELTEAIRGALT